MEAPLGSEWNTRVGFQRGTLPRVVKKVRQRCLWGPGVALLSRDVVLVPILWSVCRCSGVDRLLLLDGHCDRSTGKAVLVSDVPVWGVDLYPTTRDVRLSLRHHTRGVHFVL